MNEAFLYSLGVSFVVPLFGGWIADSFAGKYNTLFGSLLIYLVGTCLLPAVAFKYSENLGEKYTFSHVAQCVFFGVSLLFISLGTGGIKANVSPFGAEQVQSLGPQAISIFFNWFYWFINVGSFISYTGIVYVQTEISFFVGYLILCGAIFLATILLVSGKWYSYLLFILYLALQKWKITLNKGLIVLNP